MNFIPQPQISLLGKHHCLRSKKHPKTEAQRLWRKRDLIRKGRQQAMVNKAILIEQGKGANGRSMGQALLAQHQALVG